MKYKGKVAFCFLTVGPIKNPEVWDNFFRGYEDYYKLYSHISGNMYDEGPEYFSEQLWMEKLIQAIQ